MPKIFLVSNSGKKASFTFVDNIVGETMFNLIKKREKNIINTIKNLWISNNPTWNCSCDSDFMVFNNSCFIFYWNWTFSLLN